MDRLPEPSHVGTLNERIWRGADWDPEGAPGLLAFTFGVSVFATTFLVAFLGPWLFFVMAPWLTVAFSAGRYYKKTKNLPTYSGFRNDSAGIYYTALDY